MVNFIGILFQNLKNERLTFFQVEQSIKNILGNKVKLSVRQNPNSSIFDGGSDILYSDFTGQISKTTIDIDTVKNKINRERLGTLLHEFQHVADHSFTRSTSQETKKWQILVYIQRSMIDYMMK